MSDSESSNETIEAPTPKKKSKKVEEPAPVVEETPAVEKPTKGTECTHPSNVTGYHQKAGDGKCIYCGQ